MRTLSQRFPILAFALAALLRWAIGLWRYVVWTLHGRPIKYAVGAREFDDIRQVPVRSEKADAKRQALAYARARTGDPKLTWGQARKRMQKWLREERALNAVSAERLGGRVPPPSSEIGDIGDIPDRVTERRREKVSR